MRSLCRPLRIHMGKTGTQGSGSFARGSHRPADEVHQRAQARSDRPDDAVRRRVRLGFGRIAASEIEAPNMFVDMV